MARLWSLAPLTAIQLTPPELVEAASRAGYDAVGLRLSPFRAGEAQHPMLGETPMLRETEARLRDTGLQVLDIEVLLLTPERNVRDFLPVLETGQRLGARHALTLIDIQDQAQAASICRTVRGCGTAGNDLRLGVCSLAWAGECSGGQCGDRKRCAREWRLDAGSLPSVSQLR
jgi:hypothetical protein